MPCLWGSMGNHGASQPSSPLCKGLQLALAGGTPKGGGLGGQVPSHGRAALWCPPSLHHYDDCAYGFGLGIPNQVVVLSRTHTTHQHLHPTPALHRPYIRIKETLISVSRVSHVRLCAVYAYSTREPCTRIP